MALAGQGPRPLGGADLSGADLGLAYLNRANLRNADLRDVDLSSADLRTADLRGADLREARLVHTKVGRPALSGAVVYGVSLWDLEGTPAEQHDLVITKLGEPGVTVDDLEVAQFMYLLLNSEKLRSVIDTTTSEIVLILGRFTPERTDVLDALRDELRNHNLSPVLFDFGIPLDRWPSETVTLLARMSRFIIADLTDPTSVPKALQAFVSDVVVPVQPIIEAGHDRRGRFPGIEKYPWTLETYVYDSTKLLLAELKTKVINPANMKRAELEADRSRFRRRPQA